MNPAAELRAAFDRAFAEAPRDPAAHQVDLLIVRAAAGACAIVQAEIAELHAGVRVVPVPSPCRELLGIANVRGAVVAVFDLRIVLGHAPATAPRWFAVARDGRSALAFDALDRHVRVADHRFEAGERPGIIEIDGVVYPVIDVPAVLAEIASRGAAKEP